MNFHIFTFGCQMNISDSDWLSRSLAGRGMTESDEADARIFIINTCSVRDKPEQKVYSMLGRLKKYWEQDKSVFACVGGCVAQQIGRSFWDRFPFVRLVFGADGIANAPQAIERLANEPDLRLSLLDFSEEYLEREQLWPEDTTDNASATARTPSAQAFVSIMQGCDNYCAYCIVPFTRGRQKSRSSASILEECRTRVAGGARELTLLGQNVNSYGLDKHGDGTTFAQLLRQVAAIPNLHRLRFTTSHPKDLADDVIAAFGELSNLCPSLHLPLQSGSSTVLKSMGRKYTLEHYMDLVRKLKIVRPDIALTTDLIVGFPGETEEDFQQTLEAMRQVEYDSAFSFRYSDRPGVRAEKMEPKVENEEAARRLMELQTLQEHFTSKALKNMVQRTTDVLLEGASAKQGAQGETWFRGRDPYGHVVNVQADNDSKHLYVPGNIVPVTIVEAKKHSLMATPAGEPW